jgi:hypothetical protein
MRVRVLVLVLSLVSVASVASADKSSARAVLAARRAKVIERLHAYRMAEVFPTDASGMPLGVFRDANGVRCPMSELVFQSGRSDLVDAVVKLDNRIQFADITGGPLYDWLLQSGLTQEEAIQIQGAMRYEGELGEGYGGTRLVLELDPQAQKEVGHASVLAKLDAAEQMLATNTATSLTTAVDRLAERRAQIAAAVHTSASKSAALAAR